MRFINRTGNTIRLPEIDVNIPFLEDSLQTIDVDSIRRSRKFQSLCSNGSIEIVEPGPERIEQNLFLLTKHRIPPKEVKVLFKGTIGGSTGFAKANRNFISGLLRNDVEVALLPEGAINGLMPHETDWFRRLQKMPSSESIFIHSCIPTFAENYKAKYRVLYTTVEAASIPQQFIESCDKYDEVWTPSDFCKDVFLKAGLTKPIHVIPNSIDPFHYHEGVSPSPTRPELKAFKFVSVFSWNYRKGYDLLLKAYLSEFTADDPVSLLLVSRYETNHLGVRLNKEDVEIKSLIEEYGGKSHPHVARCGIEVVESEMPKLYKYCNCFVLPTRGEGFGLPFLEASLCGLPVIGTRHGGQTMFMSDKNSYMLDVDEFTEASATRVHYWDGQSFPNLTSDRCVKDLGKLMRDVFTNYGSAVEKNKHLQKLATDAYSPVAVGATARSRLEEICQQI